MTDFTPYQHRQPIETTGKPLSEVIIEERRRAVISFQVSIGGVPSSSQAVALPVAGYGAPASGVRGFPVAGSTSKGLNSSSSFPISRTAGMTSSPMSRRLRIWSS